MAESIVERQEKWEPVAGVDTAAARAVVKEDDEGLVITLMFSETVGGPPSNLRIKFGRVAAYTVHDEFVHPWDSPHAESPMVGDDSLRCVFPLLLIHNSEWLRSLSNRLHGPPDPVHYRLLTLDQIVDVLCSNLPEVSWA